MSVSPAVRERITAADPNSEGRLSYAAYTVGIGSRQSFQRLLLEFEPYGTVTYRAVHKGFLDTIYYDLHFTAPVKVLKVLLTVLEKYEN